MINYHGSMNFPEWLEVVKQLFQNEDVDYHEVADQYNFRHDWADNKTPEQAVSNGIAMLDA